VAQQSFPLSEGGWPEGEPSSIAGEAHDLSTPLARRRVVSPTGGVVRENNETPPGRSSAVLPTEASVEDPVSEAFVEASVDDPASEASTVEVWKSVFRAGVLAHAEASRGALPAGASAGILHPGSPGEASSSGVVPLECPSEAF
ncbi:MAG: hypothetical protein QXP51_05990, partial [Candidatus Hadarchaeales archaeon]